MAKKTIKVLYFINGPVASADDEDAMSKYSVKHQICIRNADMIHEGEYVEDFDIVDGAVPAAYAAVAKEKKPAKEKPKPQTTQPPAGSPIEPPPAPTPPEGSETPPDAPQGGGQPPAPEPTPQAAVAAGSKPKPPQGSEGKAWKPNA